jgi:hypothetical protein
MGYTLDKSRNKWVARATINGKRVYIGRFDTEKEAKEAYFSCTEACAPFNLEHEMPDIKFNWKAILKDPILTLERLFGPSQKKKKDADDSLLQ